jgi:peptidyl-prolyl cis-trans isomerase SurA
MKYNGLIAIAALGLIWSCTGSKNQTSEKDVVGSITDTPVSYNEIYSHFKKNSTDTDSLSFEQIEDFSHLYLTYRAKLVEARKAGYHEMDEIQSELQSYAEQYAVPYWMQKKVEDEMLSELMERSDTEFNSQHILVKLPANPTPADTAKVYNKLLDARQEWLDGAKFESLNRKYSSVDRGRPMGGEIGFVSAGPLVKPYEDRGYTIPVDSISMPFQTQFGYHIMKVLDREPKSAERLVSHIFVPPPSRSEQVIDTLVNYWGKMIYNKIESGELSWPQAVTRYTQDPNSRGRNGTIGFVRRGQFNEVLNDSIFGIHEVGEYTRPFYSGYGMHIIKLDSVKTYISEDEKREELLKQLKKLPRYKNNKEVIYQEIRSVVAEATYDDARQKFRSYLSSDSVKSNALSEIDYPTELVSKPLYKLHKTTYTLGDYVEWLKKNKQGQQAARYSFRWFDAFKNAKADEQLVPITAELYPEFKETIKEYERGLMVFNITQDSVWNYAQTDTSSLLKMFNQSEGKYQHKKRYDYVRVTAANDSLLNVVRGMIADDVPLDTIRARTDRTYLIEDVITDISQDPFDKLGGISPEEITDNFAYKMRQSFFYLREILPPGPMNFDEAYNRLVSDYQPVREEQWNQAIRDRNDVNLNQEKLRAAYLEQQGAPAE